MSGLALAGGTTDHYWGRFLAAGGPDLLHAVHTAGREQEFAQGDKLQAAGTMYPDGPVLVIGSGFVSTAAIAASGNTLLSIHGPGDLACEHVLFGDPSDLRKLTVAGMTQGSAWWVSQKRFRQILDNHPQGWEILARHLHDRRAAAEERICLMASETAGRRLAVFLLQLLSYDQQAQARCDQAQQVPLQLSQTELAEWIGVSRETIERLLSGWVRRGLMETGRRSLLVRDVPKLEKIAGVRPDITPRAA